MNWMMVTFRTEERERASALVEAFDKLWRASGMPPDAALFVGASQGSDDIPYYFTPAAAQIAGPLIRLCYGQPCDPADPARVTAAIGSQDAERRLLGR